MERLPSVGTTKKWRENQKGNVDISLFLRGLIIGVSIAVPVGPVGILCMRRTLAEGRAVGLASGFGAATADAMYGVIAAFGVTFLSDLLVDKRQLLQLVGGAFLCCLGVRMFYARLPKQKSRSRKKGLAQAFVSTFLITLTNPMTIIAFTAIFAAFGLAEKSDNCFAAVALVGGVFAGSSLWWLVLSHSVHLFRKAVTDRGLRWINRTAGAIIFCFGVIAFAGVALRLL